MSNLNLPWRILRLCPLILSETDQLFVLVWGLAGTESPYVSWGTWEKGHSERRDRRLLGGTQGRRQRWAWGELQTRALQGAPQREESAEQSGPRESPASVTRSSPRTPQRRVWRGVQLPPQGAEQPPQSPLSPSGQHERAGGVRFKLILLKLNNVNTSELLVYDCT